MKLYRIRRKSDKKFLGEGKKSPDKHGNVGKFYTTPFTALQAIDQGNYNKEDYEMIEYIVKENFSESADKYATIISYQSRHKK